MIPTLAELADLRAEQLATLIHTCTVTRPGTPVVDADGHTTYTNASHLSGQACALYPRKSGSEGEIVNGVIRAVVTWLELQVPLGTDITTNDTVTSVLDENGASLGGPFNLRDKEVRAMHIAFTVRAIT